MLLFNKYPKHDVLYINSGHDALCLGQEVHRCRAVAVKSYVPYFSSGRYALCVVRDARTVTVPSLLKDTYLTFLQAATHCVYCETRTVVVSTLSSLNSLLFSSKNPPQMVTAAPSSGEASKKTPEARATMKSSLTAYQRCFKTCSQLNSKAGAAGC